jgi:thiol-disulfide isomerase/thioredoxin
MKSKIVLIVFLSIFLSKASFSQEMLSTELSELQMETIDGKKMSLSELKGKTVYLVFWASWCVPCKTQAKYANKLQMEFHDKNFVVVNIAIDDEKEVWKKSVAENNIQGLHLYAKQFDKIFTKELEISGIPHYVLIDKEGKIVENDTFRPQSNHLKTMLIGLL